MESNSHCCRSYRFFYIFVWLLILPPFAPHLLQLCGHTLFCIINQLFNKSNISRISVVHRLNTFSLHYLSVSSISPIYLSWSSPAPVKFGVMDCVNESQPSNCLPLRGMCHVPLCILFSSNSYRKQGEACICSLSQWQTGGSSDPIKKERAHYVSHISIFLLTKGRQ